MAWGQSAPAIQFPNSPGSIYSVPPNPGTPYGAPSTVAPSSAPPTFGTPGFNNPGFGGQPAGTMPGYTPPAAANTAPSLFDPYSNSPAASQQWWSGTNQAPMTSPFNTPPGTTPLFNGGTANPRPWTQSNPFASGTGTPYGSTNPFGQQTPYGSLNNQPYGNQFGTTPDNSLFPNGFGNNTQPFDWNSTYKLFQDLRIRHTWLIDGDDPTDLSINDTETSITLTVPNFLYTNQPLYLTPAFALHLWDGPRDIAADLPANAYSAYLDSQWSTDPTMQLGAELGVRVGVYSDFRAFNSKSLRVQGLGLGTLKITPTLTAKLGVMYINRNKIKLLPAGGFVWQPNPKTRFDIFFPQPRFSQMITNLNQGELWWYVSGEYGGGAWTIERTNGTNDRVDINDVRIGLGLEWHGPRDLDLFFEGGFALYREVVYVDNPLDTFKPGDGYYIRGGISF